MARTVIATSNLNSRIAPGGKVLMVQDRQGVFQIVSWGRTTVTAHDEVRPPDPAEQIEPSKEREPTFIEGTLVAIRVDHLVIRTAMGVRRVQNSLHSRIPPGVHVMVAVDDSGRESVVSYKRTRWGRPGDPPPPPPSAPPSPDEPDADQEEAAEDFFEGFVTAIRADHYVVAVRD